MTKMLQFSEKSLRSIKKGVNALAKAVKVTLGPKGRNVVMRRSYNDIVTTKDGVTVAKEIVLKDKFENLGAQLVIEAASKTSSVAGDGTTTAVVLAEAIFLEGVKNIAAGANPMKVKKGIDQAIAVLVESLNKMAKDVSTPEEIKQIATISANNDVEIGEIISKAMEKVGKDGLVTTTEGKGVETVLEVVEGMQFDKGYLSPYFITNAEKMSVEFEKAKILITDEKISAANKIIPILEKIMSEDSTPFLIIAEDIDGDALTTLVINKIKGGLPLCSVKAPAFGDRKKEMMQDIAALTGATFISKEIGMNLDEIEPSMLGSAKKIRITKDETTIIEGSGKKEEIEKRANEIRAAIATSTSDYDKEKLEERLAKLVGGVALIKIGATTEAEMKEKKDRVEDALHATKAAVLEGTVPGGGVALLSVVRSLDSLTLKNPDEKVGVEIVKRAVFAPCISIADNCGRNGISIAEKIYEKNQENWGYNGIKDDFSDLIQDGVIDPVLVTKSALVNGASIASMLLTSSVLIVEKPKPKQEQPPPMDGYGGGMPPMGGMGGLGGMM